MTIATPLRRLAIGLDPVVKLRVAGIEPDPWQQTVLRTTARRIIVLATRQGGKSLTVGTKAVWTAETERNSEIVIGAPKQDQSAEMLRKAMDVYNVAGHWDEADVEHESILRVQLANRSRVTAVPGAASTVRSLSALRLLILDEAAYVPDEFYQAVFPMLAVSRGSAFLLSTPHAKVGAFYDLWMNAPEWDFDKDAEDQEDAWLKIKVPWWECPRIRPEFIAAERRRFGDIYVQREYCCEFVDTETSVFTAEEVAAMGEPTEQWAGLW